MKTPKGQKFIHGQNIISIRNLEKKVDNVKKKQVILSHHTSNLQTKRFTKLSMDKNIS